MARIVALGLIALTVLSSPALADMVSVTIPAGISAAPGQYPVLVPINISDATVGGADLLVKYDPTMLSIADGITDLLFTNWSGSISSNPPEGPLPLGQFVGSFANNNPAPGADTIVTLKFHALPAAAGTISLTVGPNPYKGYGLSTVTEGDTPASYSPGSVNVVPEPSSFVLLAIGGLVGIPVVRRVARQRVRRP
jgi:hypothetical protein